MANALAIVTTNNYMTYTPMLLWTMRAHSGITDIPLTVITTGLEPVYEKIIRLLWPSVRFIVPDVKRYNDNDKWWPHFFSFEIFNPAVFGEYDKVLFLDSDMINLPGKQLHGAFEKDVGLGMVFECGRQQYNAGCILAGKDMRTEAVYDQLLRHQKRGETFGRDQAVYHELYRPYVVSMDYQYNRLISEVASLEDAIAQNVALLHYIYKPHMADERIPPDAVRHWKETEQEMKAYVEARV